jgi:hypothetical protein
MKQEDKDLLIKDLCCRLPYGVKAHIRYWSIWSHQYNEGVYTVKTVDPSMCYLYARAEQYSTEGTIGRDCDFEIKPYLFPLSSMTEEQWNNAPRVGLTEFTLESFQCGCFTLASYTSEHNLYDLVEFIQWLLENHFDINGLIPKGLAIDATGLNIY